MHCTVFGCFFCCMFLCMLKVIGVGVEEHCRYYVVILKEKKKTSRELVNHQLLRKNVSFCYCFLRAKSNWHY